jgi:hypothetical protein
MHIIGWSVFAEIKFGCISGSLLVLLQIITIDNPWFTTSLEGRSEAF